MTNGDHRVLVRGVAAGTIMGVAIGLLLALFMAMKPEFFARLIQ
jgi:tetrahydromethanopterin S-methyltransferase subunit F